VRSNTEEFGRQKAIFRENDKVGKKSSHGIDDSDLTGSKLQFKD